MVVDDKEGREREAGHNQFGASTTVFLGGSRALRYEFPVMQLGPLSTGVKVHKCCYVLLESIRSRVRSSYTAI